jgi:hypothetical protein
MPPYMLLLRACSILQRRVPHPCFLALFTGPKPGFDGKVYIKLNGWNGGSDEYEATTESGGSLVAGGVASVSLKCTESWVSSVTIRVVSG